ncbi:uncharacterized protein [Epargyreus clarus]
MDDEFVLSAEKEMDEEIKKLLAMKTRDRDYAMTLKGTIGGLQNLVRELTAYSLASIPKPEEINDEWGRQEAERIRHGMEKLTRKMQETYVYLKGFDEEVDKIQEYFDTCKSNAVREDEDRVKG